MLSPYGNKFAPAIVTGIVVNAKTDQSDARWYGSAMRTLLVGLGGLVLAFLAAIGPALAEDEVPLRAGRVSLAEPGAGYRPAGGDWSGAVVNLPVATGTALRSGR